MRALVLGAGGFIGSHMVRRLKDDGYFVVGADIKAPEFENSQADVFMIGDLRDKSFVERVLDHAGSQTEEIYQFAADMGGAGYIFTGAHDADVMANSSAINLNILDAIVKMPALLRQTRIFYSSSACIYPEHIQTNEARVDLREEFAYPAAPDSEYGWEKLFSERLYLAYHRNYGLKVRVGRYHNVYGPMGTWRGGKEKAPAAICRKVAESNDGFIEVWGDGNQTRSFLFIEDCIEATIRFTRNEFDSGPINIGSEEMVSINQLVETVTKVSGKEIRIKHIPGPLGVRGRNSNNEKIRKLLDWDYSWSLEDGIRETYGWISSQLQQP
jgi:nucleoside-diphosphate-sugar epimerase